MENLSSRYSVRTCLQKLGREQQGILMLTSDPMLAPHQSLYLPGPRSETMSKIERKQGLGIHHCGGVLVYMGKDLDSEPSPANK